MNHKSHSDHSFSQPIHFGYAVVPVVLGAGFALMQDNTSSTTMRAGIFVLLVGALLAGIGVLKMAKRFEGDE